MSCKPAPACKKALEDATKHWLGRNRASDGICGDAAHAARSSDHNPDASGFAHAFDLTNDPKSGPNCDVLAGKVIHDPRVKYVIWEGKIWKSRTRGWDVYRGPNPHNHHMHVSINSNATHDLSPWPWSPDEAGPLNLPLLKLTFPIVKRESVMRLQERLKAHGADVQPDGMFGLKTQRALVWFQRAKGLTDDGIAGPFTWKLLLADK